MRILITGASGYVGVLLAGHFLADKRVEKIIATDVKTVPDIIFQKHDTKLAWETGRLEDECLVKKFMSHLPIDAVIHTAFIIRPGYGRRAREAERINMKSCENIFKFCFENKVKKLIYFSTAAVYGAKPGNVKEHFFKENEPLREDTYPYGVQKRRVEGMLGAMYAKQKPKTKVIVVRPCGITGPRGQKEASKKISLISFLKKFLPLIPEVSEDWTRQFIHEDDLVRAIELLVFKEIPQKYEVFNLAPHDYLTANDIAKVLGKKTVRVPHWLMNAAFTALWHITKGMMPTPPGSINFYRYPINLDGTKITKFGFRYKYGSKEALLAE